MADQGEGVDTKIATQPADAVAIPQSVVAGKPEPWQARTLLLLQQRVREAQADLAAAMSAFAPEPGCSLINGEWVTNGR